MDIQAGDIIRMKKPHPCGSVTWEVLRIGQDFRLKCTGCGRQVMMKRTAAEKGVREIRRPQEKLPAQEKPLAIPDELS